VTPSQSISKFVTIEGTRLHFVIKGTGRPVVLIHGNPGSCQDWIKLYGPITARYQAVAFDRPGHGQSERPKHVKAYSVDDALLNYSLPKLSLRYPEIRVPVVIVTGDSDLIVPSEENSHRLHGSLPASKLTILPRTGHQIPFSRADAVVEAIDHVASLATAS
jgi:pimeloyl-ACP methyl ester carboxylesterase